MACLGSYFGYPSDPPGNDGPQTLEWSSKSLTASPEMSFSDTALSLLGPPCEGASEWVQARSRRGFSRKGKVKTDVLSLFKTLTHETLPNLRHFAFPLATPSAWNHKRVGGILGGLFGPVSEVREMAWLHVAPLGSWTLRAAANELCGFEKASSSLSVSIYL